MVVRTRHAVTLLLGLAVLAGTGAGPAAAEAGTDPVAALVIAGASTEGHTFHAYRIAEYASVSVPDDGPAAGLPVGFTLRTVSLELARIIGPQVAAIEDGLNGATQAPVVAADGSIDGQDPLVWASLRWDAHLTFLDTDRWDNAPATTRGPWRDLADWFGDAVQQARTGTGPAAAVLAALPYVQVTGSKAPGADVSTAVFADLPAGLYAVAHPHPQGDYGTPSPGTHAPTLLVGTRLPTPAGYRDLYASDGSLVRTLGRLNVKGDAVGLTKTIDATGPAGTPRTAGSPTFAVGDAVPIRLVTNIPWYDNFRPTTPLLFELRDTHSAGLSAPDAAGSDPTLADLTVTVGTRALTYAPGCVVGLGNTSTACFAFTTTPPNDRGEAGFTLRLPDWVLRAHGGDTVVVTYEQRLTTAARPDDAAGDEAEDEVAGGPTGPGGRVLGTEDWNRASAVFSANSGAADYTDEAATLTATSEEVAVFTVPLVLTKLDAQTGAALAGVAFQVQSAAGTHCFVVVDGVAWNVGAASSCATGASSELVTGTDGVVQVAGLAGLTDYTVVETRTAPGYSQRNLDIVRFVVRAEPRFSAGSAPTEVLDVSYRYTAVADTAASAGVPAFLVVSQQDVSVPTASGNETRTTVSAAVTVLNGRTDQAVDQVLPLPRTGLARVLPLPRTGGDLVAAYAALGCLVAGLGALWLSRRQRAVLGPATPAATRSARAASAQDDGKPHEESGSAGERS